MKKLSFTAFDVETANSKLFSICSIGVVVIKDGEIVLTEKYFVRPPENTYSHWNIRVHNITPDLTENSPEFPEVWHRISKHFTNQLVISHNISFDRSALQQALNYYQISFPFFREDCTYRLSGLKLNKACLQYGIELNHHDSLSDALACAILYMKLDKNEVFSPKLVEKKELKRKSDYPFHEKVEKENCIPNFEKVIYKTMFFKEHAVISGVFEKFSRNELAKLLCSLGCYIQANITNSTSFLITGSNFGPRKYENAKRLGVKILKEHELYRLLPENPQINEKPQFLGSSSNRLKDKKLLISGVFQNFTRDELKKIIDQHGGTNVKSVSGNTTYLVAGENMGPAKRAKAEKLSVQIISEEEFIKMLS